MGTHPLNIATKADTGASRRRSSAGIFVLLVLVLSSRPMPGQDSTYRVLRVEGVSAFSAQELEDVVAVSHGARLSHQIAEQAAASIVGHYHSEGYLFARWDSVRWNVSGRVTVWVNEGLPVLVDTVVFEGSQQVDAGRLLEKMELVPGSRFVPRVLENDIGRMLALYEDEGFPLSAVRVQDVEIRSGENGPGVAVTLDIAEGNRVAVREVFVEGNTTTRKDVIVREARVRSDEPFRGELLTHVKRRLERMQLFASVSNPELRIMEDRSAALLVRVVEGRYNSFDGVVGYVPPSRSGEQGYVTGLVHVQFRNVLGTARKVAVRWFRENRISQEVEFRYHEPWVASLPLNAGVGFVQRKQDSVFVRETYDLAAEFMVNEEFSVGGHLVRTGVIPSEGYGRTVLPESRITTFGLSLRYDTRDNPALPTSGAVYRTEYSSGRKTTFPGPGAPDGKTGSTQRATVDIRGFITLASRQVFAPEFHARDVTSPHIDAGDLYRLGGASTLRGYREGQFVGPRMVWANLEYRYLTGGRSYFFGFIDVAYFVGAPQAPGGPTGEEQRKFGYGAGVLAFTPLGSLGVSLALGEGDTFGTAKLHVRLVNEF